jgi:hypothetical protein
MLVNKKKYSPLTSNNENFFIRHGASQLATKYDLNDMMFPNSDLDFSSLSEIYYTSNVSSNKRTDSFDYTCVNSNYLADEEKYLERVAILPSVVNDNQFNKIPTQSVANETRSVRESIEKQRKIGIKAEHFFSCWLKNKYGDSYNVFENWLSKARNTVYPSNSAYASDTLGYDFMINDYLNVFRTNSTKCVKKCFIEVKGTEGYWDGKFHLSRNEKKFRDKIATNKENETYLIVIIENVYDPNLIDISRIIDWSANFRAIDLCEETYLATLATLNKNEIEELNNQHFSYNYENTANSPFINSLNNPNPSRNNSGYRINQKSSRNQIRSPNSSYNNYSYNGQHEASGFNRNNNEDSQRNKIEINNQHLSNNPYGNENNYYSNNNYNNGGEQRRNGSNRTANYQTKNPKNYKH